jgi:hypothetical protein
VYQFEEQLTQVKGETGVLFAQYQVATEEVRKFQQSFFREDMPVVLNVCIALSKRLLYAILCCKPLLTCVDSSPALCNAMHCIVLHASVLLIGLAKARGRARRSSNCSISAIFCHPTHIDSHDS